MVTSLCFGTQVVPTSQVFVYSGLPGTLRLNQELRRTQRTARPCAPLSLPTVCRNSRHSVERSKCNANDPVATPMRQW
jgi:hypothetical protein